MNYDWLCGEESFEKYLDEIYGTNHKVKVTFTGMSKSQAEEVWDKQEDELWGIFNKLLSVYGIKSAEGVCIANFIFAKVKVKYFVQEGNKLGVRFILIKE